MEEKHSRTGCLKQNYKIILYLTNKQIFLGKLTKCYIFHLMEIYEIVIYPTK